jgi:hypothetical protein
MKVRFDNSCITYPFILVVTLWLSLGHTHTVLLSGTALLTHFNFFFGGHRKWP